MHTTRGMLSGMLILGLVVCLAATNRRADATSFNCQQAGLRPAEKLICQTPSLSTADKAMAALYLQANSSTSGILAAQRQWLLERNRCTDTLCLYAAYATRIRALLGRVAKGTSEAQEAERALALIRQEIDRLPTPEKVEMPPTEPRSVSQPKTARFDCRAPKNDFEQLLCRTPALLKLNDALTQAYQAALKIRSDIAEEHKSWWADTQQCLAPSCVQTLPERYRTRIAMLRGMKGESGTKRESRTPTLLPPIPQLNMGAAALTPAVAERLREIEKMRVPEQAPWDERFLGAPEPKGCPKLSHAREGYNGQGCYRAKLLDFVESEANPPSLEQERQECAANGQRWVFGACMSPTYVEELACEEQGQVLWETKCREPAALAYVERTEAKQQDCARQGLLYNFGVCITPNEWGHSLEENKRKIAKCELHEAHLSDKSCRNTEAFLAPLCHVRGLAYGNGHCLGRAETTAFYNNTFCGTREGAFYDLCQARRREAQQRETVQRQQEATAKRACQAEEVAASQKATHPPVRLVTPWWSWAVSIPLGVAVFGYTAWRRLAMLFGLPRVSLGFAVWRVVCAVCWSLRHPRIFGAMGGVRRILLCLYWPLRHPLVTLRLLLFVSVGIPFAVCLSLAIIWENSGGRGLLKLGLIVVLFVAWGYGVYGFGAQFVNKTYAVNNAKHKVLQAGLPTAATFVSDACKAVLGYAEDKPVGIIDKIFGGAKAEYTRFVIGWQINLWALLSVLVLGVAWMNPWAWGWPLRWFLAPLAGSLMLGDLLFESIITWILSLVSPAIELLTFGLLHTPTMPWWGWWVLFGMMPFFMVGAWFYVILRPLGLVGVEVLSLLIVVPVFFANQLLQIDQALQRYRVGRTWIVGRLQRFRDWLYGTPQPVLPDDSQGARLATTAEAQARNTPHDTRSMAFGHLPNERGV